MILPTTYASALLLLIVSFLCLGLWINTFKFTGSRWRFELYSIDFAIGAAVVAALAAFTFGTLGSDLAFSDRLLVAGRASQAFAVAAGFLFNLGNMLLLAAVSLLGISGAFPIAVGSALVISSLFSFRSANVFFLAGGVILILLAVITDVAACRLRDSVQRRTPAAANTASSPAGPDITAGQGRVKASPSPGLRAPAKPARKKTAKGVFISFLSGTMLGFFYPVATKGMSGELSLGPYAGILLFAVGIVISTVLFDFYFLNIAIEGGPLSSGAYLQGKAHQHFLGFAGGGLWALGALAALLALAVPAQAGVSGTIKLIVPLASVLLASGCGAFGWKEFKAAPANAKRSLYLAFGTFACGLVSIGFAAGS